MDPTLAIENFFNRLRPEVLSTEGWSAVESTNGDLQMSRLETSPGVSLLRTEHSIDAPLAEMMVVARPEVFFHPRRLEFDEDMLHFQIEQIFAPGDVMGTIELRYSKVMMRRMSVLGTPQSGGAEGQSGGPWCASHRIRYIHRLDFPEAGQSSLLFVPMHPETRELVDDSSYLKAVVISLRAHADDPGKTQATEVRQLVRVPTWALALGVESAFRRTQYWAKFRACPNLKEVTEGPTSYVVIAVRKCERGPPMLPCPETDTPDKATFCAWVQAEVDGFAFASYVRTFLERLGLHVPVYDSMYGRTLVPYQAALQRAMWDEAWVLLAGPFRVQRSAYRRILGGARAPELAIGVAPRFLPRAARPALQPPPGLRLPVQKTFVHYATETPSLPRSGSDPALRSATAEKAAAQPFC